MSGNHAGRRLFTALSLFMSAWLCAGCATSSGCKREYGVYSQEAGGFKSQSVPCSVSIDSGNTVFAISKIRDDISEEDRLCLVSKEDSLLKLGATVLTSSRICLPPGAQNPFIPAAPSYLKHLLLVSALTQVRLSLVDSLSNNYFFICDSVLPPGTYNIHYNYGHLVAMQPQPVFEGMNGTLLSGAFHVLLEIDDVKGTVIAKQLSKIQIR